MLQEGRDHGLTVDGHVRMGHSNVVVAVRKDCLHTQVPSDVHTGYHRADNRVVQDAQGRVFCIGPEGPSRTRRLRDLS